jgi:hypothetical protein
MSVSGRLQEYSLPEVFKMVEEGQKSGLLNIRIFDAQTSTFQKHYIWVKGGAIVGLSQNLDGQDLITRLSTESIVDPLHHAKLRRIPYDLSGVITLGDYLQQQNWLTAVQLQALFEQIVLQPILALFRVGEGFFTFNRGFAIPPTELIGLHLSATRLNLRGLQALSDWTHLEDNLPEPTAGILETGKALNPSPLSELEQSVLTYGNGQVSIKQTAELVNQPIAIVQQIAFRLIAAGLAEELPMVIATSSSDVAPNSGVPNLGAPNLGAPNPGAPVTAPMPALSEAFLNNLTSFLQQRTQSSTAVPVRSGVP